MFVSFIRQLYNQNGAPANTKSLGKSRFATMAILTSEQLETIKNHKYVAGTYTPIDLILNPAWLKLTTFLPLWMAPNLVTLLGWFHMIFLWSLITSYAPTAPDW